MCFHALGIYNCGCHATGPILTETCHFQCSLDSSSARRLKCDLSHPYDLRPHTNLLYFNVDICCIWCKTPTETRHNLEVPGTEDLFWFIPHVACDESHFRPFRFDTGKSKKSKSRSSMVEELDLHGEHVPAPLHIATSSNVRFDQLPITLQPQPTDMDSTSYTNCREVQRSYDRRRSYDSAIDLPSPVPSSSSDSGTSTYSDSCLPSNARNMLAQIEGIMYNGLDYTGKPNSEMTSSSSSKMPFVQSSPTTNHDPPSAQHTSEAELLDSEQAGSNCSADLQHLSQSSPAVETTSADVIDAYMLDVDMIEADMIDTDIFDVDMMDVDELDVDMMDIDKVDDELHDVEMIDVGSDFDTHSGDHCYTQRDVETIVRWVLGTRSMQSEMVSPGRLSDRTDRFDGDEDPMEIDAPEELVRRPWSY